MCGRMALTLPPDAMAQIFAAAPANDLPPVPNYNICPTNDVAIVTRDDDGQRRLNAMRWGFIPTWYKKPSGGPLLINARSETIAEKPAFAAAARARRGIIMVTGFYEWTKAADDARDPWYITRGDAAPLAFAAVWQSWRDAEGSMLNTCAIVTCPSNAALAHIHNRMPVMLEAEDWPLWLGERGKGAARLMQPAADEALTSHLVSRAVNSNRAAGPELIEPFDAADDP